jgi:hypothetical protein
MTVRTKIVVPVAAITVVLFVLGISLGWPTWTTILVVVAGCVVGGSVLLAPGRTAVPERPAVFFPPPVPEPQQVVQSEPIGGINLASSWRDYDFNFAAVVYWRSTGGPATSHVRPAALAIEMIIRRAADIAANTPPDMVIRLQHRLNDVLGVVEADPSGRVEAWAGQVQTTLWEEDATRLRALATIRKNKELWEHERRYECDRRQYLSEDVLKSTGSALVWWLSKNEGNVSGAVDLIGVLARLTAAAKDEDVPELFRHLVPSSALPSAEQGGVHLAAMGSDGAGQPYTLDFDLLNGKRSAADLVTALMDALKLDDEQRGQFADRVAANIEATGDRSSAEEVRRRFDVLTEDFDDPETEPDAPETYAADD